MLFQKFFPLYRGNGVDKMNGECVDDHIGEWADDSRVDGAGDYGGDWVDDSIEG